MLKNHYFIRQLSVFISLRFAYRINAAHSADSTHALRNMGEK